MLGFAGYLILRTKKSRPIAFIAVGVLAGAAVMTASRGVVMWCGSSTLVIMAAFIWGAPWRQGEASRVVRSIQRIALLAGLAILFLSVIFPEEINSRLAIYNETLNPYSSASELVYRAHEYPLKNFIAAFDTPTGCMVMESELPRLEFNMWLGFCTRQTREWEWKAATGN